MRAQQNIWKDIFLVRYTYAFLAQLQHNVDVLHILKIAVEFNNVCMVKATVYSYFLCCFLFLIVLYHQLLGDDFSSENIVRLHINNLVAFCKSSLQNDIIFWKQ